MNEKLGALEMKIRSVVDLCKMLRKENERLKNDLAILKSQVDISQGENRRVQRIAAEYEQMKRSHDQAVGRVERALNRLNAIRLQ